MMARPVAQYLACFGARDREPSADLVEASPTSAPDCDPAPAEDITVAIESARDDGYAQGMAAAAAEYRAELAREKLLFEGRLASERSDWTQRESEILADKFGGAFRDIEARIAASVAHILQSVLGERLRRKVVEALVEDIGILLGDKTHKVIAISGPADLLAELRQRLPGFEAAIEYVTIPSIDVRVIADQTIIDSRLEAWLERINLLPE